MEGLPWTDAKNTTDTYIHFNLRMTEHGIKKDQCINYSGTSVSDRTSKYMDCLIKEANETCLDMNNFNRDSGFILGQKWYPVTKMLVNQEIGPGRQHLTVPTSPC